MYAISVVLVCLIGLLGNSSIIFDKLRSFRRRKSFNWLLITIAFGMNLLLMRVCAILMAIPQQKVTVINISSTKILHNICLHQNMPIRTSLMKILKFFIPLLSIIIFFTVMAFKKQCFVRNVNRNIWIYSIMMTNQL
jgi:hypothetical protein